MSKVCILLVKEDQLGTMYFAANKAALASSMFREGEYRRTICFDTPKVGIDAAEEAFDLTNNPSREEERESIYGYRRSLSIGDIAEVDGELWLCLPSGWYNLSDSQSIPESEED